MKRFCRWLVCNVLLACSLTACSTPGTRAQTHATALRRLSPADQQLVLHGHVRPGMSQDAVYIAWGSPDEKTSSGGGKSSSETWIYRQRVTLYEPMNAYYYSGPYHGFGTDGIGRGFLPGCAYGGVGYEGTLRYQPHVRSLESVRIAEFSGGSVDRFKSADGAWTRRQPAAALTARAADRSLPHLVRHSVRPDHPDRTASHLRASSVGRPVIAADPHRLHRGGHAGYGKSVGVRAVSVGGSKAGSQWPGSHGTHPGHPAHHLGHSHGGSSGQGRGWSA